MNNFYNYEFSKLATCFDEKSIYEVCMCEAPLSLRRARRVPPLPLSLSHSPSIWGHEVGGVRGTKMRGPEKLDDPKQA